MSAVARRCRCLFIAVLGLCSATGCTSFETTSEGSGGSPANDSGAVSYDYCGNPTDDVLPDYPKGLHVAGDHIEDGAGNRVILRGASHSGSEYLCAAPGAGTIFEGGCDESIARSYDKWKINTVRIPLNESCWRGHPSVSSQVSGANYKAAIVAYVKRLHKHKIIPILELHWAAPGTTLANAQPLMPNADNTPRFWTDVATTFLDDKGVIFEPFNEPAPSLRAPLTANDAWACWQNGCTVNDQRLGMSYQAAGMQSLVDAIRATGADQLLLVGGIQYSNVLDQWRARQPADPRSNVAAAWHIYNGNPCQTVPCYDGVPADLATTTPIVATEIGEYDCQGTFVTPLMAWLDQHGGNYLAWSWNAFGMCSPPMDGGMGNNGGNQLSLITDFATGTPNGTDGSYALTIYDHFTQ